MNPLWWQFALLWYLFDHLPELYKLLGRPWYRRWPVDSLALQMMKRPDLCICRHSLIAWCWSSLEPSWHLKIFRRGFSSPIQSELSHQPLWKNCFQGRSARSSAANSRHPINFRVAETSNSIDAASLPKLLNHLICSGAHHHRSLCSMPGCHCSYLVYGAYCFCLVSACRILWLISPAQVALIRTFVINWQRTSGSWICCFAWPTH